MVSIIASPEGMSQGVVLAASSVGRGTPCAGMAVFSRAVDGGHSEGAEQ